MKPVFVSSTFKDMQFERDALQKITAPKLDDLLSSFGESVYFGDLRWGVNTTSLDSEEGSRRVLEVCLDEIDDCKPYMIVLIGERYGWIPNPALIGDAAEAKGIDVPRDMSVTQLEIEYGALLNPEAEGRVRFYFRELDTSEMNESELRDYTAESELHKERIDALKARILATYPDAVRTYTARFDAATHSVVGLEGFLSQVAEDLGDVFVKDLKEEESLPWQERAIRSASRYYLEHAKHYCPVAREPRTLFDGTYGEDEPKMLFIRGDVGVGKTAFVSHLYTESLRNDTDGEHLPFVLGLDKYSTTEMDYFKILLYKVEELAGIEHYECSYGDPEHDARVFEIINENAENMGGMIHSFVDNCSFKLQNTLSLELLDTHIKNCNFEYFNWRHVSHPNLDFAIAYGAAEKPVMLAPWFDFSRSYILDDIEVDEVDEFVNTLLKSKHKELASEVIEAIKEKESATSPTYLKLVVDRLLMLDSTDFAEIRRMGDGMDNINRYQIALIDRLPDAADGMAGELIRSASERIDRELVMRTVGLLLYSGVTLSEEEIRDVFTGSGWSYSSLDFALATRSLSSVINYNPREKTYSITNPFVISFLDEMLKEEGYRYVAGALLDYLHGRSERSITTRLGRAALHAASYTSEDALVNAYLDSFDKWHELFEENDWVLARHGAEFTANIVTRVATFDEERDFSFLIERIPSVCLTSMEYEPYCKLLQTILGLTLPDGFESDDILKNSLAVVAWCKLVLIKMRLNATDAAPLFHSYIDEGYINNPITDRARVNYYITLLRFTGKESYQSMNYKTIDFDIDEALALVTEKSFPRPNEVHLYRANLESAFVYYSQYAFDIDNWDPEGLKELRRIVIRFYDSLSELMADGDGNIFSSDDIARMIDTALEDKEEYSEISYERLSQSLKFMLLGQTYVDSKLNKYLPQILTLSRFSYDDTPIELYRKIVAYSRAIAGATVTIDDCLFATIEMGYAADILSDCGLGGEYFDILSQLDRFIRISMNFGEGDARVLYRIYTPLRNLLTQLDIYGLEDASASLLHFLVSKDITDEQAPLMPELFLGSLIFAFRDKENLELRDYLRNIRDEIKSSDEYSEIVTRLTPEFLYIDIDLRNEDEIREDEAYFGYSDDDDLDVSFAEDGEFSEDDDADDGYWIHSADEEDEDEGKSPDDLSIEELMSLLAESGIDPMDLLSDIDDED